MAFVAINPAGQLVGVSRLVIDAGREWGDYDLLVRSDQQRIGLGTALLQQLLLFARAEVWRRSVAPFCAATQRCSGCAASLDLRSRPHLVMRGLN
ncbi:GNAT family N-acetyltransferase [Rhizobium sullae]|nr:GNAT family N-acetyltransferase [Rhizobium sullae]